MSHQLPGWDDERISHAYEELTAGAIPGDLRLGKPLAPITRGATQRFWIGGLAAAAAVVVLVAVATLGGLAVVQDRSADPSGSILSPAVSPGPSRNGLALMGNPLLEVADLLARRDGGDLDAREVFVHGWLAMPPFAPSCPAPAFEQIALERTCPDFLTWLMQDPERLYEVRPNGASAGPPVGPAINAKLLQTSDLPAVSRETPRPPPTEVIAMGHFDDHRATFCRPEAVQACREAFVIDRILHPAVRFQDQGIGLPGTWADVDGRDSAEAYGHLAKTFQTLFFVVSTGAVDGTDLAAIEPGVAEVQELTLPGAVWIIRVLEPTGLRTLLVRDADIDQAPRVVWQLTDSSAVRVVADPSATPPAGGVPVPLALNYQVLCTVTTVACDHWVRIDGPIALPETRVTRVETEPPPPLVPGSYEATFTITRPDGAGQTDRVVGSCQVAFDVVPDIAEVRIQVGFTGETCHARVTFVTAGASPAPS